jgi:hypothetical protein
MAWWQAFGTAWAWYIANRDAVIPLGGLVGGVAVAWAALRQAAVAGRRHHAQTEADRQRRITESFSKAVEQLASDKTEARVGGIYTLERLSHESSADYWPVMEVLTAFIRERSKWQEPDEMTAKRLAAYYEHPRHVLSEQPREHELSTDVAAALTVIGRRSKKNRDREKIEGWSLDFSKADLREVRLHELHLEGAKFFETHLEGAQLWKAHLQKANFWGDHLESATFTDANLENADFSQAYLKGTTFYRAYLKRAQFIAAHLERTFFGHADVEGVNFWRTNLEGALSLNQSGSISKAGSDGIRRFFRRWWKPRDDKAHLP